MFFGRFMMIVPMLAIAGNLAGKKIVPASAGTFPVTTPLFTMLLVGVILIVGALTFFPALSLGPVLEHLLLRAGHTFSRSHNANPPLALRQENRTPRRCRCARQAEPARHDAQPSHVRGRDRLRPHDRTAPHQSHPPHRPLQLQFADHLVALVHGTLRQLRRSHGRRPRQGASRCIAPGQVRDHRLQDRRRQSRRDPEPAPPRRRRSPRRRRPDDSGRRRGHRRGRLGRRVSHHRRVRTRHPRGRGRSLRGNRRHTRALRRHTVPHHFKPRRDVPRSHDRARRRRRTPEDSERNRTQHPPCRPHHHLPARGRHTAAICCLLRRAADRIRSHRAARLPHPHDYRRPALGHRYRGHGSARATQRPRHLWPRRRSCGRREHTAAR